MQLYYFLPVLFIGAVVAYSMWVRQRMASMSPEQLAEQFHASYAPYFDLGADEKVVGAWSGVEFQGPRSAASRLAGAALNSASAAVVGVSTYVPNVQVGLTSTGRLLVSREHSELGERGHYKQLCAFAPGANALDAAAAHPGESPGDAPKNPYNPLVSLEFVQLRGEGAEPYEAWMSPQGGQLGQPGFRSILQAAGAKA